MPTLPSAAREGLSGPFEGKGKEEKYRGVLMLSREARLFVIQLAKHTLQNPSYSWLPGRIYLTRALLPST